MRFLTGTGEVDYNGSPVVLPMVRDEWVRFSMQVNLDTDEASMYYGETLLGNYTWNNPAGGLPQLAGIDFWAPAGSSPMYFDDVALTEIKDLTWDENHSTLSWNSNHWTPGGGPPDETVRARLAASNTDVVRVDSEGATAFGLDVERGGVNIMANQLLEIVNDANFADGTTLTLGNNATLSVGSGIADRITAAINPTISVTGGRMTVDRITASSTDNFTKIDGGELYVETMQVRSSTVFHVDGGVLSLGGANPLGGSTQRIALGGGTLQLRGREAITDNLVRYGFYDNLANTELKPIDDGLPNGLNGGVFLATPTTARGWTGEVWQQGNMDNTYTQMWSGFFKAPETGIYEFYVHGDDYEVLYIDKNQNGEFDGVEELVTDNAPPDG